MKYSLYTLNCPETNVIRYVGYTSCSLKERYRCHIKDINRKCINSHKNKWLRSLLAKNLTPSIHLISVFDNREDAISAEIDMIKRLRNEGLKLTNNTDGGEGGVGYKFTPEKIAEMQKKRNKNYGPWSPERRARADIKIAERLAKKEEERLERIKNKKPRVISEETRRKMSDSHKGKVASEYVKQRTRETWTGRKHTDESRAKMSASLTGRKRSKEAIEKSRLSRIGKERSEETKLKISAAHKGRVIDNAWREKMSLAKIGVKRPMEFCVKISLANKGKKRSPEMIERYRAAWVKRKEAKLCATIS